RQDKVGKKIESAPDQHQVKLEALALFESSLLRLRRTEDERAGNILILREPVSTRRWRRLKDSLVGARCRQWAVLGLPALRDATQASKSVSESAPKHVRL